MEGELAGKAREADELRLENEALKAENTRLTDLTRMLLSSPAFSTFLDSLSTNSGAQNLQAPPQRDHSSTSDSTSQPQLPKDANPHQVIQNQQIGMTFIPDNAIELSSFESANNIWLGNMDLGFNNAQVFAVTDLPEGPSIGSIDIGQLSGKTSEPVDMNVDDTSKSQRPTIERMPETDREKTTIETSEETQESIELDEDVDFDESDPAYSLFVDAHRAADPAISEAKYQIFGEVDLEKGLSRLDLVVASEIDDRELSTSVMARFERMCSNMEAISSRVVAVTSHL